MNQPCVAVLQGKGLPARSPRRAQVKAWGPPLGAGGGGGGSFGVQTEASRTPTWLLCGGPAAVLCK